MICYWVPNILCPMFIFGSISKLDTLYGKPCKDKHFGNLPVDTTSLTKVLKVGMLLCVPYIVSRSERADEPCFPVSGPESNQRLELQFSGKQY